MYLIDFSARTHGVDMDCNVRVDVNTLRKAPTGPVWLIVFFVVLRVGAPAWGLLTKMGEVGQHHGDPTMSVLLFT